jgi:uncharacterized protein YgiM (DUF1202 family)
VMKNFLLGLSKFVLGIIVAMLIVSLAGLSMARYFMTRMVELPDRPTYDNEQPESPTAAQSPANSAPADTAAADTAETQPAAAEAELPEGAYRAMVVSSEGLVVRAGPGTDYEQLGGLDYQQSVNVLSEESGWQKIDFGGGQEGWIKGGNTERE